MTPTHSPTDVSSRIGENWIWDVWGEWIGPYNNFGTIVTAVTAVTAGGNSRTFVYSMSVWIYHMQYAIYKIQYTNNLLWEIVFYCIIKHFTV